MGLDGFTMRNLGAYNDVTSAHLAEEAKQLARTGNENKIKDVDELDKRRKVHSKEEDEDTESGFASGYFEEEEEEEFQEGEGKKYKVKLNPTTHLIELIDTEKDEIIETISPQQLMELIKNLNSASGILVNKTI